MIAVGVGVAPMIQTLRGIFKYIDRSRTNGSSGTANSGGSDSGDERTTEETPTGVTECSVKRIVLLYGVVRNA